MLANAGFRTCSPYCSLLPPPSQRLHQEALFSLVLAAPVRGVISYALALIGLAITGIAVHRPALPLLPFLAVAFICLGLLPSFG